MKNKESSRYFIAVPIAEDIRATAVKLQEFLRNNNSVKITYVKPENLHITLKFLGELPEKRIEKTIEIVSQIALHYAMFTLESCQIGFFPKAENARVVFWEMNDNENKLKNLANTIEKELAKKGFEKEKKISPHLTLGRIKYPIKQQIQVSKAPYMKMEVNRIIVFQSFLYPEGPIYKHVSIFQLQEENYSDIATNLQSTQTSKKRFHG